MTAVAAAPTAAPIASSAATPTFGHGADFEKKLAAMIMQDSSFVKETLEYLDPRYMTNAVDRNMIVLIQSFMKKYHTSPEPITLMSEIKATPAIDASEYPIYARRIAELMKIRVTEREFIRQKVNDFCKRQALLLLAAEIPDLLDKGDIDKINKRYRLASSIGTTSTQIQMLDYFATARERRELREKIASGEVTLGITTGFPEIDDHLYRRGFPRKGLTAVMAPSKRGKTALMLQCALYQAMQGMRVLYISLEVGEDILTDRLDACLTGTEMENLISKRNDIEAAVNGYAASHATGKFYVEVRPSASLSAMACETIVESYFESGCPLDAVYVDYIGIMKMDNPDDRYTSLGNAAKALRGIAGRFDVSLVTGAQTNRDAVNKETAGMESIGESFAIVQDCDLLMSVNATKEEMAAGIRRIHWAASRNEAEKTITVQGDLEKMQLIQKVAGVTA